jgi:RNA polymerase sigma factor (sigma-70 family)
LEDLSQIFSLVEYNSPALSPWAVNDHSLIQRIASEDQGALSDLYDRYANLVYTIALNTLGDTLSAEEVTQDVFLRVWNKAESYDPSHAKVSTWLCSIARYRAIDLLRSLRVRPEGHSIDTGEAAPRFLVDPSNPELNTQTSLENDRVRKAVASLPNDQQQVLVWAYFRGYKHQEISERLEIPLGTAKTRIRLALQKLRGILKED